MRDHYVGQSIEVGWWPELGAKATSKIPYNKIKGEIEAASRLRVTGLVSNAHLLEETDAPTVIEGLELARAVGERGCGSSNRSKTCRGL